MCNAWLIAVNKFILSVGPLSGLFITGDPQAIAGFAAAAIERTQGCNALAAALDKTDGESILTEISQNKNIIPL